jgi:hypothetical protein
MTQLRSLTLHLLSSPRRRSFLGLPPPPGERMILPALTRLQYRGTSKYLDSFVARIDAPHLADIDITLISQPTMDASQLGRFIERIEMQSSLSQAEVKTTEHAISVSFINSSASTPLRLRISCKQLDWQLSCMARVCHQFSPFLFCVEDLSINTTQFSSGQDDEVDEHWAELVCSFGGARDLRVANELTTEILRALGCRAGGGHTTTMLPSLRQLRVESPRTINEPSWAALLVFITSRSLSGRLVQVNVPFSQCHICHASYRHQEGLQQHLRYKHAKRIACSRCADFECTPEHDYLFRDHIVSKHPEDVYLFSNTHSTSVKKVGR